MTPLTINEFQNLAERVEEACNIDNDGLFDVPLDAALADVLEDLGYVIVKLDKRPGLV